jgi:CheY-like chemotaxis protein
MQVLVVEDHEALAEAIGAGLRREGMSVDVAFDGADGTLARLAQGLLPTSPGGDRRPSFATCLGRSARSLRCCPCVHDAGRSRMTAPLV